MFPKPDDWFKKAFEQWEQQTADWWTSTLRDPAFLKMLWQSMETTLHGQQMVNDIVQQQLQLWQLPTREKQDEIQHHLNRLHILVDDLHERVDDLLAEFES